jgi:polysaccharide chain length determinant protein (PEP-CTERM system associated)
MDQPTTLTPADILAVAKRRTWSFAVASMCMIMIAALVALLLPSIYKSTATILIEEQEIPTEMVMTTVTSFAEQRIQQLNQRIMSYTRLLEIIDRFNLYADMKGRNATEEIVEQMRKDTALKPVSAEIIDRRTGRPTSATIAFTLSYEGKDPAVVEKVANTLTSLYLEENLKVRTKQAQDATEFLNQEMSRVRQELADIDAKTSAFKEKNINQLPELMQLNLQTLNNIERSLDAFTAQLRSLKEREGSLQTQLAGVKPNIEKEEELINRKRLEELRIQLVNLKQRFSDEHPDVRKTRTEIAEMEAKVEAFAEPSGGAKKAPDNPAHISLASQLASTKIELQSVQRQIDKLNAEADDYRRRITATPKIEEEYGALLVARTSTQGKLNDLMRKLMEAQVASGLEKEQKGERFTLIDPPRLPEKPFKPNRLAILLIGLVLGIGAGVGMAVLREFSDDAVRSADRLETETRLPVLTAIPVLPTPAEIRKRNVRRFTWVAGAVGAIALGALVFHYAVMDLDILWFKLARKLEKM